ncbi:MAG: hypothetical protein WEC00_10625, partial [Dongiaceae bacterium]
QVGPDSKSIWRKISVAGHEHPKFGDLVDVAALRIESDGLTKVRTVLSKESTPDFYVHAGAEVFILGYPAGLTASEKFPLWKRGTIASEPELGIDGLPKFLVDTATYKGMSGSAVYVVSTGTYVSEKGQRVFSAGQAILNCRFVGMYSSRLNVSPAFGEGSANEGEKLAAVSQIGVVWKRAAIDELIGAIHQR